MKFWCIKPDCSQITWTGLSTKRNYTQMSSVYIYIEKYKRRYENNRFCEINRVEGWNFFFLKFFGILLD